MNCRRIFAAMLLVTAAAMLVFSGTLLPERVKPLGALLYWAGCLLATFAAILCALLDLGRSLRASHNLKRELIEETIREIRTRREHTQPPPIPPRNHVEFPPRSD
jgi:hypothetical protein